MEVKGQLGISSLIWWSCDQTQVVSLGDKCHLTSCQTDINLFFFKDNLVALGTHTHTHTKGVTKILLEMQLTGNFY